MYWIPIIIEIAIVALAAVAHAVSSEEKENDDR